MDSGTTTSRDRDRAEELEGRFTVPVILAALASVPAMFLTALEGRPAQVGTAINYATLAVFVAEAVVLFALAGDRQRWLRDHWLLTGVALATVPAVVFAVGPVQVLRLIRFVGALRVLRVRRIFKAGRILRERAGVSGRLSTALAVTVTVLAAAFVAIVLSDPTGQTRRLLDQSVVPAVQRVGLLPTIVAGLLLAGATVVVWRARRQEAAAEAEERAG